MVIPLWNLQGCELLIGGPTHIDEREFFITSSFAVMFDDHKYLSRATVILVMTKDSIITTIFSRDSKPVATKTSFTPSGQRTGQISEEIVLPRPGYGL